MALLQTVLVLARRAVLVAYAYAIATLIAGALIALWYVDWTQPALGLLAALLLVAPGLVLLLFIAVVRGIGRAVLGPRPGGGAIYGASSLALLSRPWYWAAVLVSFLAGLVLVPLAFILWLIGL